MKLMILIRAQQMNGYKWDMNAKYEEIYTCIERQ